MQKKRYYGFYWTLPVPWAKFTDLPSDVNEASERSRTIRYQRDLIRRWAKDEGHELVGEKVFVELQPDRTSHYVADALKEIVDQCLREGVTVAAVNFHERHLARPHEHLRESLESLGVDFEGLHPDPIMMEGAEFDPIEHFRGWRNSFDEYKNQKSEAIHSLSGEIHRLRDSGRTWAEVADQLNAQGYETLKGKPWTKDNARKFVQAH